MGNDPMDGSTLLGIVEVDEPLVEGKGWGCCSNKTLVTDELKFYLGIVDHNMRHETVKHSEEVWLVGDVYTNSIGNVWGACSNARSSGRFTR